MEKELSAEVAFAIEVFDSFTVLLKNHPKSPISPSMKIITSLLLLLSLNVEAQDAQDPECRGKFIDVGSSQLESLTTPFFKILSYYTKDSRYDPSADLIYFMALNFYLKNNLTYEQNKELEKLLDQVPGATSYLAPTTDVLIPHMIKYLEKIGANTKGKDEALKKTDELMNQMRKILPEVQGGNRVIYRVIENEHQKIVKQKGEEYIVKVDDCPVYTLMDMHEYAKFNSPKEEREELKNRVNTGDIMMFLKKFRDQLSDKSFFKEKLNKFINENSN